MKTSQVFALAKQKLAIYEFICFAIDAAVPGLSIIKQEQITNKAKEIIQSRLGEHDTLNSWLRSKGIEFSSSGLSYKEWCKKMQAHRSAWLDLLIAEFQAKGD